MMLGGLGISGGHLALCGIRAEPAGQRARPSCELLVEPLQARAARVVLAGHVAADTEPVEDTNGVIGAALAGDIAGGLAAKNRAAEAPPIRRQDAGHAILPDQL